MSLKVQTVTSYLEKLAPRSLALDWDNVGLILGDPTAETKNILVALNFNEKVLKESLEKEAGLIITHHPIMLRPINKIRTDLSMGSLLKQALINNINLYVAHTNLDIAEKGVNSALAEAFSLQKVKVLKATATENLEKLVVFVPENHIERVRDAISRAGAGWIGNYSHCTFQTSGMGTFMPLEGTNPYIGEKDKLEKVTEVRLETIISTAISRQVLSAMLKAHPYEEVAFDLYPLTNSGKEYGLGRVGELPQEITLDEFVSLVKETLDIDTVKVVGEGSIKVKKVALCGGSGGDLISATLRFGADVLLTGDLKYHQAEEATALGLAVVDAGHDVTEKVVIPPLVSYLKEKLAGGSYTNHVFSSQVNTNYWKFI